MGWFKKKNAGTGFPQKNNIGQAVAKGILASIAGESSILSTLAQSSETNGTTEKPNEIEADKK